MFYIATFSPAYIPIYKEVTNLSKTSTTDFFSDITSTSNYQCYSCNLCGHASLLPANPNSSKVAASPQLTALPNPSKADTKLPFTSVRLTVEVSCKSWKYRGHPGRYATTQMATPPPHPRWCSTLYSSCKQTEQGWSKVCKSSYLLYWLPWILNVNNCNVS